MQFEIGTCRAVVSILEALVFGADGACIDLSMPSVLMSLVAFVVAVVVLRYLALAALVVLAMPFTRRRQKASAEKAAHEDANPKPTSKFDDGPIQSTGAWGRRAD